MAGRILSSGGSSASTPTRRSGNLKRDNNDHPRGNRHVKQAKSRSYRRQPDLAMLKCPITISQPESRTPTPSQSTSETSSPDSWTTPASASSASSNNNVLSPVRELKLKDFDPFVEADGSLSGSMMVNLPQPRKTGRLPTRYRNGFSRLRPEDVAKVAEMNRKYREGMNMLIQGQKPSCYEQEDAIKSSDVVPKPTRISWRVYAGLETKE